MEKCNSRNWITDLLPALYSQYINISFLIWIVIFSYYIPTIYNHWWNTKKNLVNYSGIISKIRMDFCTFHTGFYFNLGSLPASILLKWPSCWKFNLPCDGPTYSLIRRIVVIYLLPNYQIIKGKVFIIFIIFSQLYCFLASQMFYM